jgi:rubredoxin
VQQPYDIFDDTPADRPCPTCGKPLTVLIKEPTHERDFYQRTFECLSCGYGETSVAKGE